MDVWVGKVEVRQLPGSDHKVELSGKGAFTWITCWAEGAESYSCKVTEVREYYGLFVVDMEEVMSFAKAEEARTIYEQVEETRVGQDFCIFGTFHNYMTDN